MASPPVSPPVSRPVSSLAGHETPVSGAFQGRVVVAAPPANQPVIRGLHRSAPQAQNIITSLAERTIEIEQKSVSRQITEGGAEAVTSLSRSTKMDSVSPLFIHRVQQNPNDGEKAEKALKNISKSLQSKKIIAEYKRVASEDIAPHEKAKLMNVQTAERDTPLTKSFRDNEICVLARALHAEPIQNEFTGNQSKNTSLKDEVNLLRNAMKKFDVFITPVTVIDHSFRSILCSDLEHRREWYGSPAVAYTAKNSNAISTQDEERIGFGDIKSFTSTDGFTSDFKEAAPRLSHAEKLEFFSKSKEIVKGIKQEPGSSRVFSSNLSDLVSSLQNHYRKIRASSDGEVTHVYNEFATKLELWDMSGIIVGADLSTSIQTSIEANFQREIFKQELEVDGVNSPVFQDFMRKIYSHKDGSPLTKEGVETVLASLPEKEKGDILDKIKTKLADSITLHRYSAENGELTALSDDDISASDFDVGMDKFLSNIVGKRVVEDESGKKYAVVKESMGEGFHSEVALVQEEGTGKLFVLKEPKVDGKAEGHSNSVKGQLLEIDRWRKLDLVPADFEAKPLRDGGGKLGILATFVKGESGKDLFLDGELFDKTSDKRVQLVDFFKNLISQGVFVGDLSPDNIIHDGDRWVAIDTGMIIENISEEQAKTYYKSEGDTALREPAHYGIGEKWDKLIRNTEHLSDVQAANLRVGLRELISDIAGPAN